MDTRNCLTRFNSKCTNNGYSWTTLHSAVVNGDTKMVQMILNSGGCIDAKDKWGQTPLHVAVEKKSMKMIKLLISNGAYIDAKDVRDRTPLHIAIAKERSEEFVSLLLSSGASVDAKGKDNITSLHIAAKQGSIRNVENLLKNGACINSLTIEKGFTPLHYASEVDNEKAVNLFLDRGADINATTKSNETPLHIAAKAGCEKVIKLLLKYGANVDSQDKDGKTILYIAVEKMNFTIVRDILKYSPDINNQSNRSSLQIAIISYSEMSNEIAETLLKYGIDVNSGEANNPDLIHAAVKKGFLKIVEVLLKSGTNFNICPMSYKGFTPLHGAAKHKREEIARLLINYKADVNAIDSRRKTPIFYAISNADLNMFKLLLTNGANIRGNPDLLNIAVDRKCIDIVEALLQHGADINATDASGLTALHYTAASTNLDFSDHHTNENSDIRGQIAKLLLSKGANVDAPHTFGLTTLHFAAQKGYAQVVEVLLAYNACVDCEADGFASLDRSATRRDEVICMILLKSGANVKDGTTALHIATEQGHKEVVNALLRHGANVNAYQKDGTTALHIATQCCHEEFIKVLLEHGANVNAYRNDGTTALHIATQKAHKEIINALLDHGAKADTKININGITPLHVAAKMGNQEITDTILKYGANINSTDVEGLTPLYIASYKGHYKVVLTLLEYGADINITSDLELTSLQYAIIRNGSEFGGSILKYEIAAKALVRHIVIMKNSNLYVSEENLSMSHHPAVKNFWAKCEEEIASMKYEKINNSYISFFGILAKTTNSIAKYMRNENIEQLSKSVDFETKFPIYAAVLRNRFRKGMERKELLEQDNRALSFLFKDVPELPHECKEKILHYLSEEDLKTLRNTFKHLNICNFSYPYYDFIDSMDFLFKSKLY